MGSSLTSLLTDTSARLFDPLKRRYTDAELITWLNWSQNEVQKLLGFLKKRSTISIMADYIFTKNGLKYFKLPADFMYLDYDEGIMVNGIRYHATTDAEIDLFQEKSAAGDSTATITPDDYFDESQTGMIRHYSIDWADDAEVTAGHSGATLFLIPAPVTGDVVTFTYIKVPTVFAAATPLITSKLVIACEETLIYGTIKRAAEKALWGEVITQNIYDMAVANYERAKYDAAEFYYSMKTPDKMNTVKTAKQVFNAYNSVNFSQTDTFAADEG